MSAQLANCIYGKKTNTCYCLLIELTDINIHKLKQKEQCHCGHLAKGAVTFCSLSLCYGHLRVKYRTYTDQLVVY